MKEASLHFMILTDQYKMFQDRGIYMFYIYGLPREYSTNKSLLYPIPHDYNTNKSLLYPLTHEEKNTYYIQGDSYDDIHQFILNRIKTLKKKEKNRVQNKSVRRRK